LGAVCIHLNPTSVIQARSSEGPRACAEGLNKPKDTRVPKPHCMSGLNIMRSRFPPNMEGKKWDGKEDTFGRGGAVFAVGGKWMFDGV